MAQANGHRFWERVSSGILPIFLLSGLMVGAVAGITEVILAVSMASLIFSGDFAPYLRYGIALIPPVAMLTGTSLLT